MKSRLLVLALMAVCILPGMRSGHALAQAGAMRNLTVAPVRIPVNGREDDLYAESHALLIGVSNYSAGWPRLPGVRSDIQAVEAALLEHGFKVRKAFDTTRVQLEQQLRDFIAEVGLNPKNRLLIYFAGHGHTLKTADGRQLGYIVPADAGHPEKNPQGFRRTAIGMDQIEAYARQIESKHALFIFDSCFSGTFFTRMRASGVPENISAKTSLPVREFITAGDADQQVPDESIFRKQFVAALQGEGDYNKDGFLTGSELGMFLEEKVTNYSRRTQTPQFGKIKDADLDKGDFVFRLKAGPMVASLAPVPLPPVAPDPSAIENVFWELARGANSAAQFDVYLARYPNGQFADEARREKQRLEGEQRAREEEARQAALTRERQENERRDAERREQQARLDRIEADRRQQALQLEEERRRAREQEARMQADRARQQAELARQKAETDRRGQTIFVPPSF